MQEKLTKEKKIEIVFLIVFSALIVLLFYQLISMNGLVLGNDPAVHLEKTQIFLKTGHISLANIGWIPPLFEIMLAMVISLSGASSVGQLIFSEKMLAVIINWLLFLSVYLVGSKFFSKKIGAVAAIFLSICYPMYELSTWGGYTTALGISFLLILFFYSYLAAKQFGYVAVTFIVAFAVVLSHQLTAFLAIVIMLPVLFLTLIKLKATYLKAFIATILGGAIAFFVFYYPAIANYLDVAVYHLFFGNQTYVVDIPYVNFQSFLLYFGVIQFFAVGGIGISYYLLKRQKKLILFVTLMLSLFVPLFFAESYLFGFLLPFGWFIYYLAPPIAILGAVFVVTVAEKLPVFLGDRHRLSKNWLRVTTVLLIVLMGGLVVFPIYNTYDRIILAGDFNSTADLNSYDAAVWLNQNYPNSGTVVVTFHPGNWFAILSGKDVISQTADWYGTNVVAKSVINLDYEIQSTQNLVKAYESNNYTTDENYVSINQLWNRVSYSSIASDFVSFRQNGLQYHYALSELSRTISLDNQTYPKEIEHKYFNNQLILTQAISIQNSGCPITVSWSLSPLSGGIENATLSLTTHFDSQFNFDQAQVTQMTSWVNPEDTSSKTTQNMESATINFSSSDLADHYIGLFDHNKQTAFAYYFTDLPNVGNIDVLANRQIDAVNYQYKFSQIGASQTVTRQYQLLTLTKSSFPNLKQDKLESLFDFRSDQFYTALRSYKGYIAENNIQFIVYDKDQIDATSSLPLGTSFLPQVAQCQFLKLVYSNSQYEIFKILDNYNQTQIWK